MMGRRWRWGLPARDLLPKDAVRTKTVQILLVLTAGLWLAPRASGDGSSNVVICYSLTNVTPLNQGFAGFTTELLGTGVEYGDTNMQHYAAMLSPGWLLFPAGETGDAFKWSTGLTQTNWVNEIATKVGPNSDTPTLTQNTIKSTLGKGGVWFTNFAALAENLGGARIIVCINGFTDTNTSAGDFAAYAQSNHIQVAAWELCNEPYLFSGQTNFFTNSADYATRMKPFRDAIKAVDSNAVVAVFFSDPARTGTSWDNGLGSYSNQYWDAVAWHYYPELPTNVSFADLMAMDNGNLFSNTTMYVTNVLMAKNTNANTSFFLTEFNPGPAGDTGTQSAPSSSLYGGIYGAEMVMRLSTCPRVIFAGSYQLVNGSGVDTTNSEWNPVDKAATNGVTTNTTGLPFGYFLSAQGSGEAVAYWALNRSTAVYATTVGTNCPLVPMDTNGVTTMPAVYAQAYQGGNGKRYVLLTNKGSNPVTVQITEGTNAVTNQFLETYVTGTDPSVVNSNPPTNNVVIQSQNTNNPVTIPQYSVVRLEWTVFCVTAPTVSMSLSNSVPTLEWQGMTNVVYNVQAGTNPGSPWMTLGKASSAQTNFSYPDQNVGQQRFYRLAVP
jgi:hypothetical protein